jgi:hypothetical protein
MEEREPFPTDDSREKGTGAGHPEESPEEVSGGKDESHGAERPDAPGVSSPEEGDPGQATGNPGAAG